MTENEKAAEWRNHAAWCRAAAESEREMVRLAIPLAAKAHHQTNVDWLTREAATADEIAARAETGVDDHGQN